ATRCRPTPVSTALSTPPPATRSARKCSRRRSRRPDRDPDGLTGAELTGPRRSAEPALPASGREESLLFSGLGRWWCEQRGRRGARKEVHVDLSDRRIAHLDVADHLASERGWGRFTSDLVDDNIGFRGGLAL